MRHPRLASLGEILQRLLAWWRPTPVPVPVRKPQTRDGLTIVEMLVAMAITLIMMAAVVNVFARVSDSVNKRRATIEMASMLRTARQLLQRDLAGATCPTRPWTRPNAGAGYFEIIEGPLNDVAATRLTLNADVSPVPRGAPAASEDTPYSGANVPTGLGDYDDILALTVRSDREPFIGRYGNDTRESNLAEIIWFAVENPPREDPNNLGQPNPYYLGEPGLRTVYRRVLLIAPWVNLRTLEVRADGNAAQIFRTFYRHYYRHYDISARLEVRVEERTGGNYLVCRWIPNTLADLTMRENRFAHFNDPSNAAVGFPHSIDLSTIRFRPDLALLPLNPPKPLRPIDFGTPLHPFGYPFEDFDTSSMEIDRPLPSDSSNRAGEDIVLTDALAFDVRVYDPLAPLVPSGNNAGAVVVKPGDPVWTRPDWTIPSAILGRGAYVDLGYVVDDNGFSVEPHNLTGLTTPPRTSLFSTAMYPRSQLGGNLFVRAVYDTWSYHYETDGLDQDDGGVDEGTDGIDNDNQFGVDDMGERETSPPYPLPLRGVQVTLRAFERDSRLPRQVSVRQSFVPQ